MAAFCNNSMRVGKILDVSVLRGSTEIHTNGAIVAS